MFLAIRRINRCWKFALVLAAGAAAPLQAVRAADLGSPVGEWRTIDDNTGKPKGIVKIYQQDGALYGSVVKSLVPTPPNPVCIACTDDRRGKPIDGLQFIRGLHQDGDHWDGGTILDPETGKVYQCRITLEDGGHKLAVRGYFAALFMGRTQVWDRVD
jgi:uncharacterized protein (DUF2147 family)